MVFSRGTPQGLREFNPLGGQICPMLKSGASLLWKKAQKNAKKKQTSEMMNKIMPIRSPRATYLVW